MRQYITHPLGLFIIAIHLLYFLVALHIGAIYLVDSYGYLNQAKNILEHHSSYAEEWNAPVLMDYFTIRPPLYSLFIIACKSIIFSDYSILVIQNIMSMFNMFLLWGMLKQLNVPQKNIALTLVLALLLYPSQMIHANLIMSEILLQTLILGSFYFSFKAWKSRSVKDIFYLCAIMCLAMLTKPVVFLFGGVLFVFFLILFIKQNKKALLPFLLLPLTYHLLCLQNKHVTGYYHYSSIKIMADLRVNANHIIAQRYGNDSSVLFVEDVFKQADLQSDYATRYKYIEGRCVEVYKENKITFLLLYMKGVAATLIDPGRFDLAVFWGLQNSGAEGLLNRLNAEGIKVVPDILKNAPVMFILYLVLILCWNILITVAGIAFLFNKDVPKIVRILVLLFVGYIVGMTGISGLNRYRVPVFPEMIFALTFSLPVFISWMKRKVSHA